MIAQFVAVCLLRYLSWQLRDSSANFIKEKASYYALFLVTLAFDFGFRPVLRLAVDYERHVSIRKRDAHWMGKFYVY